MFDRSLNTALGKIVIPAETKLKKTLITLKGTLMQIWNFPMFAFI